MYCPLTLDYYAINISAFTGFTGIYQGSFRQPDFFFRANSNDFSCIVIESGWVESFPHLRADKDLWMQGNISVEVMILLGWKISEGRVKDSMEIWRRDGAGGLAVNEMVSILHLSQVYDGRLILNRV